MRRAEPNRAHYALAELEQLGAVSGVITQNVDGLRPCWKLSPTGIARRPLPYCVPGLRAGRESRKPGYAPGRGDPGYLARLEDEELRVNPDGDVELDDLYIRDFQMVPCLGLRFDPPQAGCGVLW